MKIKIKNDRVLNTCSKINVTDLKNRILLYTNCINYILFKNVSMKIL